MGPKRYDNTEYAEPPEYPDHPYLEQFVKRLQQPGEAKNKKGRVTINRAPDRSAEGLPNQPSKTLANNSCGEIDYKTRSPAHSKKTFPKKNRAIKKETEPVSTKKKDKKTHPNNTKLTQPEGRKRLQNPAKTDMRNTNKKPKIIVSSPGQSSNQSLKYFTENSILDFYEKLDEAEKIKIQNEKLEAKLKDIYSRRKWRTSLKEEIRKSNNRLKKLKKLELYKNYYDAYRVAYDKLFPLYKTTIQNLKKTKRQIHLLNKKLTARKTTRKSVQRLVNTKNFYLKKAKSFNKQISELKKSIAEKDDILNFYEEQFRILNQVKSEISDATLDGKIENLEKDPTEHAPTDKSDRRISDCASAIRNLNKKLEYGFEPLVTLSSHITSLQMLNNNCAIETEIKNSMGAGIEHQINNYIQLKHPTARNIENAYSTFTRAFADLRTCPDISMPAKQKTIGGTPAVNGEPDIHKQSIPPQLRPEKGIKKSKALFKLLDTYQINKSEKLAKEIKTLGKELIGNTLPLRFFNKYCKNNLKDRVFTYEQIIKEDN